MTPTALIIDQDNWSAIQNALASSQDETLQSLLARSRLEFDGNYLITAEPQIYNELCPYFPLIETAVQDVSGRHLRLLLDASVPMGTDEQRLLVEMGSANVTEAIISPESIAAVPSYLLRFVPYVGAGAVLIAAALRQAFYRSSREHGADQLYPKAGDAVMIDVESLLASLGHVISRATFFRIFKEGSLDWFVRRADPVHRFSDGHISRQANTYTYRGMILVPGDAQDLYSWLIRNNVASDPTEVLSRALQTPRDQLMQFPYRIPDPPDESLFNEPASVHDVLLAILGVQKLNPTLSGLCDRLSAHLIRPESFLAVPWYWFRKVLPELGDDLGVLYLMCKNCCYIDWARGRDRNSFWVPGGLTTLQKWIRSETLPKRIPQLKPSPRGRPRQAEVKADSEYTRSWRESNRQLASQYLCRTATRTSLSGQDWQLRVDEVQLTTSDEILKEAIYAFLYHPQAGITPELLQILSQNQTISTLLMQSARQDGNRLCHFETLVNSGICHFETLSPTEICQFDTWVDGINCYFETLVSSGICNFETIIKILLRLKNTHFFDQNNQPADTTRFTESGLSAQTKLVGYFKQESWQFDQILGRVNPLLGERILQQGREVKFLSWLIWGNLNNAIHSPLSYAISRTLETDLDAGGPATRLAVLPADRLANLLWGTKKHLSSAYLGRQFTQDVASLDLAALFSTEVDSARQMYLLQRLCDDLGIQEVP